MIHLPDIGVGCAALSIGSKEIDDDSAVDLLVHAYERGVRYFDVAPLYGGGRGEVLLGRALALMSGSAIISTKVGYSGAIPYGGRQAPEDRRKDFSSAAIERSITDSLRRLNRESVDIVFLHDPTSDIAVITKEALPTLERMREQGLIHSIGLGTSNIVTANEMLDYFPLSCLLLAGRWTLIDRSGQPVIERCRIQGVQIIAGGVFNSGLLALDQPLNGGMFDYAPAPARMIELAAEAQQMCMSSGLTLKAAAVQFPRSRPGVGTTLLGPRTRREFDELLTLLGLPIEQSLWDNLDQLAAWNAGPV